MIEDFAVALLQVTIFPEYINQIVTLKYDHTITYLVCFQSIIKIQPFQSTKLVTLACRL